MPPIIIPEPGDTEFDPAADWKEVLALSQPGGGDVVSCERSEGRLVGQIPFRKKRDACKKILGYSWADEGSPYELHRAAPWRHPVLPWLWATSVSFTGNTPVRNDDDPDGEGYPKLESPEPDYDLAAAGNYAVADVSVGFGQLPYLVIDDEEADGLLAGEWERYFVQWAEVEGNLETISVNTGQAMVWAEGPLVNQPFQGDLTEYKHITRYTAIWKQVPEAYIFSNGQATKIQRCVGTVNSTTLFGFPPSTMLFQPPRFTRYAQPVWTADGQGLFCYDLALTWLHFSPTPGEASPLKRGWQLMPYPGGVASASGPAWYTVRRTAGSSVYFLPETDHYTIFEHVLKP